MLSFDSISNSILPFIGSSYIIGFSNTGLNGFLNNTTTGSGFTLIQGTEGNVNTDRYYRSTQDLYPTPSLADLNTNNFLTYFNITYSNKKYMGFTFKLLNYKTKSGWINHGPSFTITTANDFGSVSPLLLTFNQKLDIILPAGCPVFPATGSMILYYGVMYFR